MQLINCIPDSKDLIDDFISSVSYEKITSELFATLTDKEKELLKLFFGFYEKSILRKKSQVFMVYINLILVELLLKSVIN